MITMNSKDEFDSGWFNFFRPLVRVLRKNRLPQAPSGECFTCLEENPKLRKAFLTVRMAAEPGEDYKTVAAKIEKEANSYREFLRKPTTISKICLRVKQLPSEANDNGFTSQKYHVCDPVEGQASVFYTVPRSMRVVLEFIVYDEHDKPLFPIVRTYSDWLGKKAFNLGLGRTFHLNMLESDAAEFVRVQAGFTPLPQSEVEAVTAGDEIEIQPVMARAAKVGASDELGNKFAQPYGRRIAFAFGVQCVIVSMACGLFFWRMATNEQLRVRRLQTPSPQGVLAQNKTDVEELPEHASGDDATTSSVQITYQALKEGSGLYRSDATGSRRAKLWASPVQKTRRMAAIKRLGVLANGLSCQETGGRCEELLAKFQQAIEHDLSRWNLLALASGQSDQGSVKLVVSYKPVDDSFGHLYVTLFDHNGLLWGKEKECYEFGGGNLEGFASHSSEMFVRQLALEIIRAKEHFGSATKENETARAEKDKKERQSTE